MKRNEEIEFQFVNNKNSRKRVYVCVCVFE